MAVTFRITDAGWTAWLNALATGTNQITIAQVAFGDASHAIDNAATALTSERARVPAAGGQPILPQRIHITAIEDSAETYTICELGLILTDGTLFAQWSDETETAGDKVPGIPYVLTMDTGFDDLPDGSVIISSTEISFPPATENFAGRIEIATQTETNDGLDNQRAVTPAKLAGLTATQDRRGLVELASSLETQTGADGDRAVTPAGLASLVSTAVVRGLIELATQTEVNAGTDTERAVTPSTLAGKLLSFLSLAGGTLTGALTLAGDPTQALHAATKQYVDNTAAGLDPKASVKAATTANLAALSGLLTVDDVVLAAGNRVLVKNQTAPAQNGIYVAAAGAWARAADMDAWAEIPSAFVFVEQGTTQHDTGWTCTSDEGGTLGATAINWTQFSGAGAVTAGTGINVTGNQVSLANLADVGGGALLKIVRDVYGRISGSTAAVMADLAALGAASLTDIGPMVTQPEAEAGTLTDVRRWSPLRVKQAISAQLSLQLVYSHGASSGYLKIYDAAGAVALVIQAGRVVVSGPKVINFPVAFPSACLGCPVAVFSSSGVSGNIALVDKSATNAHYDYNGANVEGVEYVAIGY